MQQLIRLRLAMAIVGIACVLAIHVASLTGITSPFKRVLPALFPTLWIVLQRSL